MDGGHHRKKGALTAGWLGASGEGTTTGTKEAGDVLRQARGRLAGRAWKAVAGGWRCLSRERSGRTESRGETPRG